MGNNDGLDKLLPILYIVLRTMDSELVKLIDYNGEAYLTDVNYNIINSHDMEIIIETQGALNATQSRILSEFMELKRSYEKMNDGMKYIFIWRNNGKVII